MIVLLSGQIKNIGDFLITDRAKKLFEEFVDKDIVILDRTKKLDDHLETINKSKMVVLCGGPAYAPDIYKGIYPLVDDLSKIKVPIIPFGLGWCGRPVNNPMAFKFNQESAEFLKGVHNSIESSSCRDVVTESILNNNGLNNVTMTGCPVWYDLESIGKDIKERDFNKIVFTTPASLRHIWQNTKLLSLTKKIFPESEIIVTFHRGILPDRYTSLKVATGYVLMSFLTKLVSPKIKIKDVAYDLEKIDFYSDCDFHIGYRVHAHLYFLSKRLPSILINEDGRGVGMTESLEMEVLNYSDKNLFSKVESLLKKYKNKDFKDFHNVKRILDTKFVTMKGFLIGLKNKF